MADQQGFDAVPLLRRDGLVREFWSQPDRKPLRIVRRHRISHDAPIERLLPALGAHVVQFVYYRSEMVGLIDASDLNKPVARLVWLQPMLELERAILDAVEILGIDDERQASALGKDAAAQARGRRKKAARHDLKLPLLLQYAQFPSLLYAWLDLRLKNLDISKEDVPLLTKFRNRAAHGARDAVIEDRSECEELSRTLEIARGAARSAFRISKVKASTGVRDG